MSTPFASLTVQQQAEYQAVDAQVQQLTNDALLFLRDYAKFLSEWTVIGTFTGLLDPTEQIPRTNLPMNRTFVQQTIPFNSLNAWAGDMVTIHTAINGVMADIQNIVGVDNAVI